MVRLLVFIQPPRHGSPADVESWLEGDLAALRGEGVTRIRFTPLRSASLRSSTTWGWMIEVDCRSAEAACALTGEGPGMLLLDDLRMLGMRACVALVEEPA